MLLLDRVPSSLENALDVSQFRLFTAAGRSISSRRTLDRIHVTPCETEHHVCRTATGRWISRSSAIDRVKGIGAGGESHAEILPFYSVNHRNDHQRRTRVLHDATPAAAVLAPAAQDGSAHQLPRQRMLRFGRGYAEPALDRRLPAARRRRRCAPTATCPSRSRLGKGATGFRAGWRALRSMRSAASRGPPIRARRRHSAIRPGADQPPLAQLSVARDTDPQSGAETAARDAGAVRGPQRFGAHRQIDGVRNVAHRPVVRRIPIEGPDQLRPRPRDRPDHGRRRFRRHRASCSWARCSSGSLPAMSRSIHSPNCACSRRSAARSNSGRFGWAIARSCNTRSRRCGEEPASVSRCSRPCACWSSAIRSSRAWVNHARRRTNLSGLAQPPHLIFAPADIARRSREEGTPRPVCEQLAVRVVRSQRRAAPAPDRVRVRPAPPARRSDGQRFRQHVPAPDDRRCSTAPGRISDPAANLDRPGGRRVSRPMSARSSGIAAEPARRVTTSLDYAKLHRVRPVCAAGALRGRPGGDPRGLFRAAAARSSSSSAHGSTCLPVGVYAARRARPEFASLGAGATLGARVLAVPAQVRDRDRAAVASSRSWIFCPARAACAS